MGKIICPYCGEEAVVVSVRSTGIRGERYQQSCNGCGAYGPLRKTSEEAEADWPEFPYMASEYRVSRTEDSRNYVRPLDVTFGTIEEAREFADELDRRKVRRGAVYNIERRTVSDWKKVE